MDRPSGNRFLEPERGSNLVGWAVKQLVMWLIAGLVVYSVVVNHQLFRGGSPAAAPRPAAVHVPPPAAAAPAQPDRLRPLGQAAPLVVHNLTLRAQANGHVLLTAEVNGAPIRFMVDTGATWVSLTHQDALRAGVGGALNYSIPMITANGMAKAAPITLREVRIGDLAVDNVEATVMPEETGISLLGQTFLKRLRGYEMRGDLLTLSWQ
jgi:aspartyl protease family protein